MTDSAAAPLTGKRVFQSWWPLAASWILMGLELPAISAGMARLADAPIHLAAYGGVVFPLALIIEAPVIMLLAASTALSRDMGSYLFIRRFMNRLSIFLTAVHVLIAFTPLYDVVVRDILFVPPEIRDDARIGLMIMTPWTWAIAWRRFNQGVLIRFGRSRLVGTATIVRLAANIAVIAAGLVLRTVPGIVVGTSAVVAGVLSEAIFVAIVVRPVLKGDLASAPPVEPQLDDRSFLDFYIPLAMTPLIFLIALPLGTAAMTRMPATLQSLAVWPVLSGLVFTLRSAGFALNEVVVALADRPNALPVLRRFTAGLAASLTLILVLVAITPLSTIWLSRVSALPENLTVFGLPALLLSAPLPALSVLQSLYQGTLVHARRTRGITESVAVYVVVVALVLLAGYFWGRTPGLYVSVISMGIGSVAMVVWLWIRAVQALRGVKRPAAEQVEEKTVVTPAAG